MRAPAIRMLRSLALVAASVPAVRAQAPAMRSYFGFVASTGVDQVSLFRFGPAGATIEHRTYITIADELVGPRGLVISPDRRWYLTTASRGARFGQLVRVAIADTVDRRLQQPTDTLEGREQVGPAPIAVQLSADATSAFVTNFGAPGVGGSVAVIYLAQMLEVGRIATCRGALGGVMNHDATHHYSTCERDDALVDIDAGALRVAHYFSLASGTDLGVALPPAPSARCGPTAVALVSDGARAVVTCSLSSELVVVDVHNWTILRRIGVGHEPEDVAVTHDGRLVVTANRGDQSMTISELATGREIARVPATRRLPTAVVISDDDRYAFMSNEGVGGESGSVDVIDLTTAKFVTSVDVGMQAAGIQFWRSVP